MDYPRSYELTGRVSFREVVVVGVDFVFAAAALVGWYGHYCQVLSLPLHMSLSSSTTTMLMPRMKDKFENDADRSNNAIDFVVVVDSSSQCTCSILGGDYDRYAANPGI